MKKTRKSIMVTQLPNRFVLVFLLILSCISLCSSSQSDAPRNVETFYPFTYSPPPHEKSAPAQAPDPNYGVSVRSLPPPASPGTSKKAIMTAVGATAASTFFLAVVFFLLLTWYSRSKRRRRIRNGGSNPTPPLPPAVVSAGSGSEYKKVSGNVKGYIIDEDGLDVLYWKKLSNSGGFRKETYSSAEYANRKIPAVPRGKSSSSQSHSQIHPRSSINRSNSGSDGGQPPALSTMAVPKAPAPPLPPPVPQKNAPSVPPPPPPIPGKKNPPPPPSKPPAAPPSKTLEARAKEEASGSGNDDQVKLKPLHWEKVNVNPNHSMVWDKLEKGSFQYNGDMMEALFGVVATKRRSPKQQDSNNNGGGEFSNSNAQIFILDPRKSQNVAIVIKSLGIPHDELIDGLLEGKGLTAETLEKLKRVAPTKEEASKILAFDGDSSKFADAESFLYCLLTAIPSAFVRVDEMLFRSSYDSEIFSLKDSLQTLESGCNELRSRGIFLKLLEAILKAGNRLNAGTSRGDAKAFNLSTLRKLSDYKSTDGKTTLLHFVVHEVVRNEGRRCVLSQRNSGSISDDQMTKEEREREFLKLGLPVVGGLSSEFSNVKKAASIDYDAFKGTLDSISKSVFEARRIMGNEASDDDEDGFLTEARKFFESAEVEVNALLEEHTRVMGIVKRTTQYYQAGASNEKSPLQLFVTVKDFLGMVDQTCVEIARSLQQKKQSSPTAAGSGSGSGSGSTPDVLRSRVTFPRLPEHFLSDKSNSDSDEDS